MQATYKRVKNWFLAKIETILLRRLAANSCVDGKTTIEKTTEKHWFLSCAQSRCRHSALLRIWFCLLLLLLSASCCCCWLVYSLASIHSILHGMCCLYAATPLLATETATVHSILMRCYRSAWAGSSMWLPQAYRCQQQATAKASEFHSKHIFHGAIEAERM